MNTRSRILFCFVWLLSLAIPASRALPAAGPSNPIPAIALRHWPPHYLIDDKTGAPAGFAIDVMNRVAALSGMAVRYEVYENWPEAFEALRTGQAILAPNLGMTDARLDLYDFTVPYETFRISLFVRVSTDDIRHIDALTGRAVAVVKDNQGLVLMRDRGVSDLRVFNSVEEAFLALLAGGADALVYPENPVMNIAIRSGLEEKIKIVGQPLQEIKRCIAVRKQNPEVFSKLDQTLRQFIQTAEFLEIFQKWHGKPEPFWTAARVGAGMGIVLGLTVIILVTWRYFSMLKMNRSLAEAEERFRGIIEKTDAGYFFIDPDGKFRNVNAAWLRLHGYDNCEEVIGQPFTLTQESSYLETSKENVTALLAGTPVSTGEATRLCRDGSVGYHSFSVHPVVSDGKVIGFEGFIIDSTEAHLAAEAKRKLEERLWVVGKAESLACMAGAIAHHFNNQLAVVQGNLELALEDLQGHRDIREPLREAVQAARRAAEISGLMLTYLGQNEVKGEPLDLSALCRQKVPALRAALPDAIVLETDLMDNGPMVRISGKQMQQVLTHLMANAAEAIGERGGMVRLSTGTCAASDIGMAHIAPADWKPKVQRYAWLEIADSGCGLTAADVDRLFDPFFTTKFTGRGLGLSVVLGIARAGNGVVGVESEKDRGSTFRVFLPLSSETPAGKTEAAAAAPVMDAGGTVLLVEDQAAVRKMVANMLGRLGYAVVAASSGQEALELFKRQRETICCVITDLTMPGMDGWQVLDALRKLQPDLPVILASGHDEAKAMDHGTDEKPDAFLHKPYSKAELKEALMQALR